MIRTCFIILYIALVSADIANADDVFTRINNGIAFKMMRDIDIITNINENHFISPISVTQMAFDYYLSVPKDKRSVFIPFFGEDIDRQDLLSAFGDYRKRISTDTQDAVFVSSNMMMLSNKYQFNKEYIDDVSSVLGEKTVLVDFSDNSAVESTVNKFVFETTKGFLKGIKVPADKDTLFLFMNVSMFKSAWLYKFEPSFSGYFKRIGNSPVRAQFMGLKTDKISYITYDGLTCVKLPFRDKYSMLVIYSKEGLPLDKIDLVSFEKILSLFSRQNKDIHSEIKLVMPKFSIISIKNKLGHMLTRIGLPKSHSGRIANVTIPQYLENIFSLSVFEIDENGAQAYSSVLRIPTIESPYEIIIDSPFCFFIIENNTSAILFEGILLNPAAE